MLLSFVLFNEEAEKEESKIEAFKSTLLQSFPTKDLYEKLFSKDSEKKIIDTIPQTYEEQQEVQEFLKELGFGNDAALGELEHA